MMMCPKCNAQVEDNAAFCPNCGVPFIQPTPPQDNSGQTTVLSADDGSQQTTVLTADMYPQYQAAPAQPAQPAQPYAPAQPAQPYAPAQPAQPYASAQPGPAAAQPPVAQLRTNRSFLKTFLLSLLTLGIYGLVCQGHITDDVNLVCSRYDGRKSMNFYLLFFIVGPITAEIATIVWIHNLCDRIGIELKRRQVDYDFGAKDFWLWGVLGSLILIGPFVFAHKFFKSVNLMNENYNLYG